MNRQLTPQQVAELMQISLAQLCRLTKAEKIPAKDLGTGRNHCWRYDEGQLEKWIAQTDRSEPPPRRRVRKATFVQRSPSLSPQVLGKQTKNEEAHGTVCPVRWRRKWGPNRRPITAREWKTTGGERTYAAPAKKKRGSPRGN